MIEISYLCTLIYNLRKMKKIIFGTLSVAFLAVAISSCGKSSKGKMANEWKITSYEKNDTQTSNGNQTVIKTSMTETGVTRTTTNGGTTTTSTGTVNTNEMTIDKDGTWTSTQDISGSYVLLGTTYTTNTKTTESGTWSFVAKTKGDEFKKNERVIFNVLTETTTTTQSGGSTGTSTDSYTYASGELVRVYTVKESKGKELELEMTTNNTNTSGSNNSTYVTTTTIVLAEK